jgi:hypothetical protein
VTGAGIAAGPHEDAEAEKAERAILDGGARWSMFDFKFS